MIYLSNKTIMELWRNKVLSLEKKMQIVEDEEPTNSGDHRNEDSGYFLGFEEPNMTKVHSQTFPFSVSI